MARTLTLALALAVFTVAGLAADPLPVVPVAGIPGPAKDQLAGALRGLLLKNLPTPLYEAAPNWGHQSEVKRLQLRGRRREIRAEFNHEPRNDGVWRKIRVDSVNPSETLIFDLRNVEPGEPGRVGFQVFTALDVLLNFTQQRWESGLKLLDASARAKARVRVTLNCEAGARIESGQSLPELVFQLKVTKANLQYDNLKFEHIAGLGGEAAQIIGEAAHAAVRQWRPSIERDLLERANAAIVKAGGEREVRLNLARLIKPIDKP